ncbi:hypothetical protein [Amycolatopsis thermoflava]|uniref:hypothetical protein n=1 Tax=Amycolatopsis thermoflava TaxID=84480 RepID=UPI003D71DD9A
MKRKKAHDTPHGPVDPDYVLDRFRFHLGVYHHSSADCEVTDCDYCTWDDQLSWWQLVYFGGLLDWWMTAGRKPPRDWRRRLRRRRRHATRRP